MSDPFLRENWENLARENTGENNSDHDRSRDLRTYDSISEQIESVDESKEKTQLKKLLSRLQIDIMSYVTAIDRLTKHKLQGHVDRIENADRRRTMAHNVLIDDLNILSRQFDALGLDNSWRIDVGSDRKEITKWVLGVEADIRNLLENTEPENT